MCHSLPFMGKGCRAKDTDLRLVTPSLLNMEEPPKTVVHSSKFFGEPGEDVENWLKDFEHISKPMGGPISAR